MSKKVNVDDDTRYNIRENECYATTTCASVVNRGFLKEEMLLHFNDCSCSHFAYHCSLYQHCICLYQDFKFESAKVEHFFWSVKSGIKINSKCEANG